MKTNINAILSNSISKYEEALAQISAWRGMSDDAVAPARKAFGAPEDKDGATDFFSALPVKKKKEILATVKKAFLGENPSEEEAKKAKNRIARFTKALGLVLRDRAKEDELEAFLRKASELAVERGISLETLIEMTEAAHAAASSEE